MSEERRANCEDEKNVEVEVMVQGKTRRERLDILLYALSSDSLKVLLPEFVTNDITTSPY